MLKSAFLLLLLLNSLQIATANSTVEEIDEQKKAIVEILNKIAKRDDAMEQFKNMSIHGAKMYEANEKMNALDKIPFKYGWINKSHVELCAEARTLTRNNAPGIPSYNSTFITQYDNFDKVLSEIPDPKMNITDMITIFYQVSDEERQLEVAHEVHEFSQRLQCLQLLKPSKDKKFIEKMTDLYEAYCYADKYTQDKIASEKAKKDNESSISVFGIFIIVTVFIVVCLFLCWLAPSSSQ